jgi:hypothetical protein
MKHWKSSTRVACCLCVGLWELDGTVVCEFFSSFFLSFFLHLLAPGVNVEVIAAALLWES